MKILFPLIKTGTGSDSWTFTISNELRKRNIETKIIEFPHHFQYFPFLLRNSLRKIKGDIIHTNTWNGFAFKDLRPMIATEHLVVHDQTLTPYKSITQKIFHQIIRNYENTTVKYAQRIISVSSYTAQRFEESFSHQSIVIHNGIDTNLFKPITNPHIQETFPNDKIKLLFVGHWSKRKGVDLLKPILQKLDNRFLLLCITNCPQENTKKIYFINKKTQDELVHYYNLCDIFLFPSRVEGLNLSILEAMACGKPVVTNNCSSMPEQIISSQGGFLCPVNKIDTFVTKINEIANSPKLMKHMGDFNHNRAKEKFSLNSMVESYINIYKKLLNND